MGEYLTAAIVDAIVIAAIAVMGWFMLHGRGKRLTEAYEAWPHAVEGKYDTRILGIFVRMMIALVLLLTIAGVVAELIGATWLYIWFLSLIIVVGLCTVAILAFIYLELAKLDKEYGFMKE